MAVKALIFGTDDLYPQLKPFYEQEIKRGNLEIVGYAVLENDKWLIYANPSGGGGKSRFSRCNNFFWAQFLSAYEIS